MTILLDLDPLRPGFTALFLERVKREKTRNGSITSPGSLLCLVRGRCADVWVQSWSTPDLGVAPLSFTHRSLTLHSRHNSAPTAA